MLEGSSAYYPEGVVDVSIIVVSLFKSSRGGSRQIPSRRSFAEDEGCHTRHVGLRRVPRGHEVLKASSSERRREARENAGDEIAGFYSRVSLEEAISAIKYATLFRVKSWDGYIIELARSLGNRIVYTLDKELERIKDIVVVNPFPENLVKEYHEYIESRIKRRESH
jgi:hypothetical protein